MGILHNVLIRVDKFIFPANFLILDCQFNVEIPIILGKSFLATYKVLVDVKCGKVKFRINNEEVTFNMCKSMK